MYTSKLLSIIIPSRNELFLNKTIEDLLDKAAGEIEIIACLDGYWPGETDSKTPPLTEKILADKRVKFLHRGKSRGMRPGISDCVEVSTGKYLLKADGHTAWQEGYDEVLKADCDDDWVVVPRRMSLDPWNWCRQENGKPPIDYHYLSNPFEKPDDPNCGLHGTWFRQRAIDRADILVDDEQSSQGSVYFMKRTHWDRTVGPLDHAKFTTFASEFQEVGNKTWLSGGSVKVNKKTAYLHWHKGNAGRGYVVSRREQASGGDISTRYWMLDEWKDRKRDLIWLIRKFWPLPGWGPDPELVFKQARERLEPTGFQ